MCNTQKFSAAYIDGGCGEYFIEMTHSKILLTSPKTNGYTYNTDIY